MSERELLQQLSNGDSRALALLFRHYYKDLVLFAGTWLSGNQMLCENIVQKVFISLWNERKEVLKIKILKSFLLKSVQNRCISCLRHQQVKGKYEDLKSYTYDRLSYDTEDYILYSELNARLQEALGCLSPVQRQCFEMNRTNGIQQTEIAKILGIPLRTVELRIAETLKILKLHLKEYFILVCLFLLR